MLLELHRREQRRGLEMRVEGGRAHPRRRREPADRQGLGELRAQDRDRAGDTSGYTAGNRQPPDHRSAAPGEQPVMQLRHDGRSLLASRLRPGHQAHQAKGAVGDRRLGLADA